MKLAALSLAALVALPCCKGKKSEGSGAADPAPARAGGAARPAAALKASAVEPGDVQWKPHAIEDLAISFDSFANVDLRAGESLAGTFIKQTLDPVSFSIQYGAQQTVDSWRKAWAQYGPIAETQLEFCESPALKLSVEKRAVVLGQGKSMPAPENAEGLRAEFGKTREMVDGKVVRPGQGEVAGEADEAGEPAGDQAGPRGTKPLPGGQGSPGEHTRTIPGRAMTLVAFTHRGTPVTILWSVFTEQREAFAGVQERFFDSFRCQ